MGWTVHQVYCTTAPRHVNPILAGANSIKIELINRVLADTLKLNYQKITVQLKFNPGFVTVVRLFRDEVCSVGIELATGGQPRGLRLNVSKGRPFAACGVILSTPSIPKQPEQTVLQHRGGAIALL